MTIRTGNVERQTRETRISVALTLDGKGECRIRTGFGFADHMLELMAHWAGFDLELLHYTSCNVAVISHHTSDNVAAISHRSTCVMPPPLF